MSDLKKVLMERDKMSAADADMEIQNIRFRVYNGESAEIILNDEYTLEPDYIFDLF